jgi:hypothetical protein
MARFKPKGLLERTALSDLWKHTLSQIPTLFGRLAYCGSLRDQNTGAYAHHGLSTSFGKEQSERALKNSHEEAFSEWLALPMADKYADLNQYLDDLQEPHQGVVQHWLISGQLHTVVPESSLPMERDLFMYEMEALLEVLKNAALSGRAYPTSSRLQ